ncbi:tRNA (adenosine(37)-N6)-threonylcarbamoyltransferase complex ATPase subunit type 1 TsaE [Hydrogenobaculum acidophilum]
MYTRYLLEIVPFDKLDDFANTVKKYINISDIVCLEGELGAGKTTFVKAFLKSYGFENVSSPTFSIINEYQLKDFTVLHCDFYRIDDPKPFLDYIKEKQKEAISFVEWPKDVDCTKKLTIITIDENKRLFKLCF